MSQPSIPAIPELIALLPKIRRQMRADEITELDKDPLKLYRVDIPLDIRPTMLSILRLSSGDDDSEVLVPVIDQLAGGIVESGHVVMLLTAEEAQAANCYISFSGGKHARLSTLFGSAACAVDAEVPTWRT